MKNLRLLRKLKGASQKDVADYVGVTQSGYQKYETGQREPPIEVLKKLSEYFGVSIPELVSDSANPQWLTFEAPTPDFVSITTVKIPIIGHVRAGYDALAEQAVEGYMEVEPRRRAFRLTIPRCIPQDASASEAPPMIFRAASAMVQCSDFAISARRAWLSWSSRTKYVLAAAGLQYRAASASDKGRSAPSSTAKHSRPRVCFR